MTNKTFCEIEGIHANATVEHFKGDVFKLTCPRCGFFTLITEYEIEEQIIEALTKEGRYTNIERIA